MKKKAPTKKKARSSARPASPPVSSGSAGFQLLKFPDPPLPGGLFRAQPQVTAALEEWLGFARAGRLVAIGLCAVTDDGAMVQRCLHTGATIAFLVASNRLLEATMVQACLTVYKAPPGAIFENLNSANAPPKGDTNDVPEADEDE